MRALGRAFDKVLDSLAAIAGVILVAMMFATVIKVGMRYLFNHGIVGIDQLSGTMMVYITFLGAAWVLRREGHVTVDIMLALLRPRTRRAFHILASLIGAAVCLTLAYYAFGAVSLSIQRRVMVAAELEFPRAINLGIIPLGCTLLGIEFLRRAARFYRNPDLPEPHSAKGV